MRTTVTIDDQLLRQAEVAAARSGRTVSDLIDDGLRLVLAQRGRMATGPLHLPVFGGSGLRPGVDLEDRRGLSVLPEDEAAPHTPA